MARRTQLALAHPLIAPQFDQWYALYPRHVGVGAAEKAFLRVMRDRLVDFATLMERTAAYRDLRIGDPHHPAFTPHPSTWLNQRRWEDDLSHQPKKVDARQVQDAVRAALRRI